MKLNMSNDIAVAMAANLKEVKKMLGESDAEDLALSAPIVRQASAPTKRQKVAQAMELLNTAAEMYEAVGDERRAYFVTKTMAKLAQEFDDVVFDDEDFEPLPPTVRETFEGDPEADWFEFIKSDDEKNRSDEEHLNGLGLEQWKGLDNKIRLGPDNWKTVFEMDRKELDQYSKEQFDYAKDDPQWDQKREYIDVDTISVGDEDGRSPESILVDNYDDSREDD